MSDQKETRAGHGDRVRIWVRSVGAAVLAIAAVGVFTGMAPETTTSADAITEALQAAKVNEATAISAPQQNVVNGWVARDLLAIIAGQADRPADGRPAAMMLLAVLGLCLGLATSPNGSRRNLVASTRPVPVPTAGLASEQPGEALGQNMGTSPPSPVPEHLSVEPASTAPGPDPAAVAAQHGAPDAWVRPGHPSSASVPTAPAPLSGPRPNPWLDTEPDERT